MEQTSIQKTAFRTKHGHVSQIPAQPCEVHTPTSHTRQHQNFGVCPFRCVEDEVRLVLLQLQLLVRRGQPRDDLLLKVHGISAWAWRWRKLTILVQASVDFGVVVQLGRPDPSNHFEKLLPWVGWMDLIPMPRSDVPINQV